MIATATIRDAETKDILRIVEMGRKFLLEGPYFEKLADNPDQAEKMTAQILKDERARILVAEDADSVIGVFAFLMTEHIFSGDMTAVEMIWYVEPEHRGRTSLELLWTAERMAKSLGAEYLQATAPTEEVEEIYRKCGFYKVETAYQRKL